MPYPQLHPGSSRLKAHCLSHLLDGAPAARQARLEELLTGGDPACLEVLRLEALFPFLYSLLVQQNFPIPVHPPLLETLRHDYFCALQQVASHNAEAGQVLGVLADAGVGVILLKGADLRLRVYGDPAARPMTDLDLLVDPRDLARARPFLEGLSYKLIESHTNQRPGFREDFAPADIYEPPAGFTLKVDLHWGLWHELSVYGLPLAPILAQARPASFQGVPVKVLAPEHLLIHLCLHAYWDGIMARQLVDIILAASRLPVDWPRLQADACRWLCQVPLYQVLSLAQELAPEAIPASALAGLAGRGGSLLEKLMQTGILGPFTYYLASLYRQPLRQWPAFLAAKIWPDREYLLARFDSPSRWRYLRQFLQKFHPTPRR